jgi:hypothetical protein
MTPAEFAEAVAYNKAQYDAGNLTIEMVTQFGLEWQLARETLEPDAKLGPVTQDMAKTEMTPPPPVAGEDWATWDGPMESQPKSRSQVVQIFGKPGTGHVNQAWYRENIVELQGENHVDGIPAKWYFKIHRDVEPYLREGFRRANISSDYVVVRAGGFNFRHIRKDPRRALSLHSWGIAFDLDAKVNYARYLDPKNLPVPWSPEWMKIWPKGVDKAFVDAMASCGWSWGGAWKLRDGFVDPMHFEWTGRHPV